MISIEETKSLRIYPTLVATSTNNFVATRECNGESIKLFHKVFMKEIYIPKNYRKITKSEASQVTLHVCNGCKELYEVAEQWKDFGTIVENAESPDSDSGDANADGAIDVADITAGNSTYTRQYAYSRSTSPLPMPMAMEPSTLPTSQQWLELY